MQSTAEVIFEKVKFLPEHAAQEVLDFVAFLQARLEDQQESDLVKAQQQPLAKIWENEEDEVWNDV